MTSAKTTSPKITLTAATAIPFAKLELGQANVRRIAGGQSIEELAEDIAHRGLLQSLSVRPIFDAAGAETGRYEVPAGGRRYRALEHLVKAKRMAKTVLVPCIVRPADSAIGAAEDSLAENAMREALHPLDQFRAFKALAETGLSEADIAARFFVTEKIVRQRLRLAGVAPALLDAYAANAMTLECLMAFTVSEDPARQVEVWHGLSKKPGGYGLSSWAIKEALTRRAVRAHDPRAVFVGEAAYVAAGGTVLRDLFDERGEGWFEDTALLDRLAEEKLAAVAEPVLAEGWKWVEAALSHSHGRTYGLRVLPTHSSLTDAEEAAHEGAVAEYDRLNEEHGYGDEPPADVAARLDELEADIADFEARAAIHAPEDIGIAGAFVSLDHDGIVLVRRGYVRPEDEPRPAPETGEAAEEMTVEGAEDGIAAPAHPAVTHPAVTRAIITIGAGSSAPLAEPEEGERPLSEAHRIELTSYRTMALREAVADDPEAAFLAVLHAMVIRVIVHAFRVGTCLDLTASCTRADATVKGLDAFRPARVLDARREAWAKRLPSEHGAIWDFLIALAPEERTELFALCAGLSVNAMHSLYDRRVEAMRHADQLARLVQLDPSRDWQPTAANYFDRVPKARILAAVREARGEDTARLLDGLKKGEMAREAERIMADSGWLPELLRTPGLTVEGASAPGTPAPKAGEYMADTGRDEGDDAAEPLPAFLAAAE
jgi:ParB family chromosome partitioning protein